jgi:Coenzyme PQQ synthesis protein D (PqqD)
MPYHLNTPDVAQENVDGEIIIVNVATGIFYSLAGSGGVIWSELLRGLDEGAIVERIARTGGASREDVADAVARFVGKLRAENLIVDGPCGDSIAALAEGETSADGLSPFVPPTLERYSDMEELLLVDPIHEVQPVGWPLKPKGD